MEGLDALSLVPVVEGVFVGAGVFGWKGVELAEGVALAAKEDRKRLTVGLAMGVVMLLGTKRSAAVGDASKPPVGVGLTDGLALGFDTWITLATIFLIGGGDTAGM